MLVKVLKLIIFSVLFLTVSCSVRTEIEPAAVSKPEVPAKVETAKKSPRRRGPSGTLTVEPAEIIIKDIPQGEKVSVFNKTGRKIRIVNRDRFSHRFSVTPYTSVKSKNRIMYGYEDIPAADFLIPGQREIEIPPSETREIDLFIQIPDKKEYRSKKYQGVLEIKRKKDHPADLFVLSVQMRILIDGTGR